MTNSTKKVPEIRFAGFDGEWTCKTLGQFGEIRGGGTPATEESTYWGGDIPWFTPAEISKSGSGRVSSSVRTITKEGLDESSAKLLPPGSVLITSRASVGHVAVIDVPAATNQGFASLIPFNESSTWFVYHWVLNNQRSLSREASGSTFLEISARATADFRLRAPDLGEQKVVGEFLRAYGEKVGASESKLTKLRNLKQSMLVKMFPQDDSKVPEIRFGSFDGEWYQMPFGEVASRKTSQGAVLQLPRLEFEDIVAGRGLLNKDLMSKKSAKTGIFFESGDVLFGKLRPYLKNWYHADFAGLAVGDFWVLDSRSNDSAFLYAIIQTPLIMYLTNITTGSKMPRADWDFVSTSDVLIPSPEEQKLIGNYFRELDKLINAEAEKLTKLKYLKTAFLNKMFV